MTTNFALPSSLRKSHIAHNLFVSLLGGIQQATQSHRIHRSPLKKVEFDKFSGVFDDVGNRHFSQWPLD